MSNRNIAKCAKCGDIIESVHRHHYVSCSCEGISLDGGREYCRASGNPADFLELAPADLEAWDARPTGRLENWAPCKIEEHVLLWGNIYDDKLKRFRDATWIRTSRLENPKAPLVEGNVVETFNSKYLLGKPSSAGK